MPPSLSSRAARDIRKRGRKTDIMRQVCFSATFRTRNGRAIAQMLDFHDQPHTGEPADMTGMPFPAGAEHVRAIFSRLIRHSISFQNRSPSLDNSITPLPAKRHTRHDPPSAAGDHGKRQPKQQSGYRRSDSWRGGIIAEGGGNVLRHSKRTSGGRCDIRIY